MATFTITTTTVGTLKADPKGHAEVIFTVSNTSAKAVRGLAKLKAIDSTKEGWLKLKGESERDFAPNATEQFAVSFDGPVVTQTSGESKAGAAAAGSTTATGAAPTYSFRLNIASAVNPDEDFSEGPIVTVEVPVVEKKPFKWWIIPIIAVVLIAIGLGVWFAIPRNVAVPNVVGMQLEEARTALEQAKLVPVEKEIQITEAPEGQVLAQDPEAGGEVKKGTEINLTIEGATPLVVVPDVVKLSIEAARQKISEAGLSVVESGTEVGEGFELNQVTAQTPAAGTDVEPNATIELVVATSKVVTVPDVTFKPIALATQTITAAGLQAVQKEPELADANVAPGNVKRQTPAPGTKVPVNSAVELVAASVTAQVPSLVHRRVGEAQLLLQQHGLSLGTVWGTYHEGNASTVVINGQTPGAGTTVARGSNVNVTVPCITLRCRMFKVDGVHVLRPLPTKVQQFQVRAPQ